MPKRLKQQRRGKGTSTFRTPSFRYKYNVKYPSLKDFTKENQGVIVDIVNDVSRSAPVMLAKYGNEVRGLIAPCGVKVGDKISYGKETPVEKGNVLMLKDIPAGTTVYNLELKPGDGGKLVRSSGTTARVVSHETNKVMVKLPSKAFKMFNPECRATVGIVAGFGRKEKPIVKAGKNYHVKKARGKYWPLVAGVAMNVLTHPFGGKRRSTQKSKKHTASRHAPPGRKVGSIASKRTGKKKRRTKK